MTEFIPFPKMPRLNRDIVITEKLDGTNASVLVEETSDPAERDAWLADPFTIYGCEHGSGAARILAGSRNKWLQPGKQDNFGFAKWVQDNAVALMELGPGQHFGEWYGKGIQRGYGLEERRFALFNTARWYDSMNHKQLAPACCEVVPVLYMGPFDEAEIKRCVGMLTLAGSAAAPRYMNPEGVVIYHTAANHCFKVTCKNDEKPKGA